MRILIAAAAMLVAFGMADIRPANAAWECQGPAASCTSGKPASAKKSLTGGYAKKATKTATYGKKAKKVASAKKSKKSYSGGGGSGIASYYWQPQRVASGGWFNPNALTAAHKTLPFGTMVRVTNLNNGKSVTVKINDRGPYIKGRVIDLSKRAAQVVGMTGSGVARVSMQIL